MATNQINHVIQGLRKAFLLQHGAEQTDKQLLDRFINHREGAPLEMLVRRHGLMVWGVCRRLLPNHQDAEDAFQATFLVLVRKATSIVPREMVGNWLYGVANQTALKVRAATARRGSRERQVTDMPEPTLEPDLWDDLEAVLDRELSRLPDRYRAAIILCDLEGKTRKEAARQLGCPEGTVASRLATARKLLAKRLARHGLVVSAGALAATFSRNAAATTVPNSVVSSSINIGALVTAGGAAGAGLVSRGVAALVEGVIKTMLLRRLLKGTMVLLVTGMIALSCGVLVGEQQEGLPDGVREKPRSNRAEATKERPSLKTGNKSPRNEKLLISGRVDGPGGKPVAQARVVVLGAVQRPHRGRVGEERHEAVAEGRADKAGRFRIEVERAKVKRCWFLQALASAPGFGLGWRDLRKDAVQSDVVLRLPAEQVIRGRLIDLAGRPVKG